MTLKILKEASTTRFTNRINDYIRYRPSYPPEAINVLLKSVESVHLPLIADIGSGTGKLSENLLHAGLCVTCVEPNDAMRLASDHLLENLPGYTSSSGTAENTGLESTSIDLITAAQAFHWFNPARCRAEFSRILKPGGLLALIWNQRKTSMQFQARYEQLLKDFAPEYNRVNHMNIDDATIRRYYAEENTKATCDLHEFDHIQRFDLAALKGRVLSASYSPQSGTIAYEQMMAGLQKLFDEFAEEGQIRFDYITRLFLGRLN